MKAEYLNIPLNSSMRDWYKKWFYVQQEQEPFVAYDIAQIPKQQENWSASAKMVRVEELLGMFNRSQLDRPTIALNFICRRVQPCKERVHPLYEYSGSGDPTREYARNLSSEEVNWWLAQLFDLTGYRHVASMMKAYKLTTPPPQVCLKSPPSVNFDVDSYWDTTVTSDLMSARSVARTEHQCTSSTCPPTTGQPA
jgi:hypothetical protein